MRLTEIELLELIKQLDKVEDISAIKLKNKVIDELISRLEKYKSEE
jgi:hypothetical protein